MNQSGNLVDVLQSVINDRTIRQIYGGKPPAEVHLLAEHLQAEFNVKDRVILQKCRFDERRPPQPILKIFL